MIIGSKFELNLPAKVIFECGSRSQLPGIINSFGNRALIVHSKTHPLVPGILECLGSTGIEIIPFGVSGEPTTKVISELLTAIFGARIDCVLAIGGGSVVDTGKALSALLTNPGDLMDYLEIVGKGLPLRNSPTPFIAVPTTSGTGSEVTKNAVLGVPGVHIKVSLRSPMMIPRVALIDPELAVSMPAAVTASTGMDAIVQLIEPFVSIKSNSFTDAICRQGLKAASGSIHIAYHDPDDLNARVAMSFASLCGGLALANAGLGAVHGFAGVIGGMYAIPHGTVCAALLAAVLQTNNKALIARQPNNPVRQKFSELAGILLNTDHAELSESVSWAREKCEEFGIPKLSDLGVKRNEFDEICEKSAASSSMKGNPITLDLSELKEILQLSY